jgi:hypothetical protein
LIISRCTVRLWKLSVCQFKRRHISQWSGTPLIQQQNCVMCMNKCRMVQNKLFSLWKTKFSSYPEFLQFVYPLLNSGAELDFYDPVGLVPDYYLHPCNLSLIGIQGRCEGIATGNHTSPVFLFLRKSGRIKHSPFLCCMLSHEEKEMFI